MAEVSYLHLHEHDDDHDDSFDFLYRTNHNPSQVSPDNDHSVLFDRENQVNFVIDMFHQSVEQSQSQSRASDGDHDRRSRPNDLEVFGFGFDDDRNDNGDDNSGFMFSDCWDDFFTSRTVAGHVRRPANRSGYGVGSESDFLEERENQNPIPNANDDLEWEEIDDHEALNIISGSEPDEAREPEAQPNGLEWEVLLNARNLESNPDLVDYNYTDYEMLFGQFLDSDSSLGRPPASVTVVENLSSVVVTDEDFENNTVCAVCKEEIGIGLIAKKLPCDHLYHGDCILPWLGIRNTCPVCRYELLTDDPEYERRKAEMGASD